MMRVYDTLGREGRILLDETMEKLDSLYDNEIGLLVSGTGSRKGHSVRASAHYALGLLIRGSDEDIHRANKALNAVIDTQFDCPDEIYHGTFRRTPQEPLPPRGTLPWREMTPFARYFMDRAMEKVTNTLRAGLTQDEQLKPYAFKVEELLSQSVLTHYPLVWKSYDPNWREFILCVFALILEHFENMLTSETVFRMLTSASKAMQGAMDRSRAGLTPMNTNIELMHVFTVDYFADRLHDPAASDYACRYAESIYNRYMEFHSVSEFNSPTYYGVDLAAAACWRRYAPNPRLRALGELIEAGLWEDIADTYSHCMRNICGPFSRNYEMDMSRHTSMHALLFLGLGMDKFPDRPFNVESDHNPLLVLCGVRIPPEVRRKLLESSNGRSVVKRFRELSERGDPREGAALCTATSWISDTLMTGGLSGSRNVSGQLHPATVYWRDSAGGVSSMRLQRSNTEGKADGFHLVVFDCRADKNRLSIDVSCQINRDIKVYFEFDSPFAGQAMISENMWEIGGLRIKVAPHAPAHFVEREGPCLRICYLAEDGKPETQKMHFELDCNLNPS